MRTSPWRVSSTGRGGATGGWEVTAASLPNETTPVVPGTFGTLRLHAHCRAHRPHGGRDRLGHVRCRGTRPRDRAGGVHRTRPHGGLDERGVAAQDARDRAHVVLEP